MSTPHVVMSWRDLMSFFLFCSMCTHTLSKHSLTAVLESILNNLNNLELQSILNNLEQQRILNNLNNLELQSILNNLNNLELQRILNNLNNLELQSILNNSNNLELQSILNNLNNLEQFIIIEFRSSILLKPVRRRLELFDVVNLPIIFYSIHVLSFKILLNLTYSFSYNFFFNVIT